MLILNLLIPVLAGLLGFLSCRRSWASERFLKWISQSISFLLLPCMIISAMANIKISPSLILLPLATVCVVLGLFVVSIVYIRIRKIQPIEAGSFVAAFSSLEGGSIGLALVLLLYGSPALPTFFVFDITHAIILFTFNYFITCYYGTKQHMSFKFIRSFFLGPIPLSVVCGLLIHFIFGGMNYYLSEGLNGVGYLILPAVMFVLGYRFIYFPKHVLPSIVTLFVKMLVGYGIAFAFVSLFDVSGYAKMVILISACLPPSFLVIIFAEEQGLDKDFLVTFLPIAGFVSFFALYFIFSLFGSYIPNSVSI